jgi:CRP-like cAMP-binding protein
MTIVEEVVARAPFFAGLDARAVAAIAGCAREVLLAEGDYLLREGSAADSFFVVRTGRVALEVHDPGAPGGGSRVLETIEDGGVVGWSWLVPPYRWLFDARAVEPTLALHVDAARLRSVCERDPRLGYLLLQRVAQVLQERLHATRVRSLDLYRSRR